MLRGQGCHNDADHTDQYRTTSVALIALQARLSGSLAPCLAILGVLICQCLGDFGTKSDCLN
jgi:hypothetical protein